MPSQYTSIPQSIFNSSGQYNPLAGQGYSSLLNNSGGYSPEVFSNLSNMGSIASGFNSMPNVAAPESMWNMKSFMGSRDTPGWGGMALGAAQGIGNLYMGMQQLKLAKDTLNENKRQFGLNWDAQKTTVNSQLEDRQRARVAANPSGYQSVSAYMDQNKIKG